MDNNFDWMILGGGPAGYAAALYAAKKNCRVILFEGKALGGTCLNVGCIPVKCLLEQAHLLDQIREYTNIDVLKEAGRFSFKQMQNQKQGVVKELVTGIGSLLKGAGITIVKGTAHLVKPGVAECEGKQYKAKKTLVATGSKPSRPPIPGAEASDVLDSSGMLAIDSIPPRLAIIGGGVIGLEFASLFSSLGSEVTILEALEKILPTEDAAMVALLQKNLENKGIRFVTAAKVRSISDANGMKRISYEAGGKSVDIEADRVMIAAGRRPSLQGIDSKVLGLELDAKGYIKVDSHMRTNIDNVWAAGDVIGGWQLAHAAYAEAEIAVRDGLGETRDIPDILMPRCIYTSPGLAAVGMTEEEARKKGLSIKIGTFPYAANGKALAGNKRQGLIKAITDTDGKLLGVHMLGDDCIELIAQAVVAMAPDTSADGFEDIIYPHPTLSEMVREAVLDTRGLALHKASRKITHNGGSGQ